MYLLHAISSACLLLDYQWVLSYCFLPMSKSVTEIGMVMFTSEVSVALIGTVFKFIVRGLCKSNLLYDLLI